MAIIANELRYDGNCRIRVKTDPTIEPVSVNELKDFARIDGTCDDELLDALISSARIAVERFTGRAILQQTLVMSMDYWPGNEVELLRPPLISVDAVKTIDEDGATINTFSSSTDYYVIVSGDQKAKVIIRDGASSFTNNERYYSGFEIEYKAGYGTTAASVPKLLKYCVKAWASAMFDNRVQEDRPPHDLLPMLNTYRVYLI